MFWYMARENTFKRTFFVISAIFIYNILYGQGAYIPPEKPKLVVGIIVEQLRYDQIERFRDRFGENGIRKLLNEGSFFQNASFQYLLIQSAPGHATLATGSEPSTHGITSDRWYLPLRDEMIYCTADVSVTPVGGSIESGLHSPVNLQASTFTDELKISTGGRAKVYAVGIKEHASILSAGHAADAAFWYDTINGNWMTSSYYMGSLPAWVNDFNATRQAETWLNGTWTLSRPRNDYHDCTPDSSKYEKGFAGQNYFPYDLRKLSARGRTRDASNRDYAFLLETPYANSFTTAFAKKIIASENLGTDDVTDFLAVCYTSTDYIGHRFGPSSFESADALMRLDREVEDLLNYLNENIGKRNILVYFTSAHGVSEVPGVLAEMRVPSGYFRQDQAVSLLRSYLKAIYGDGDWVKGYSEKQVFLNRTLIEDARISLEEIQTKVARFLIQFSGVSGAYPYYAFETGAFSNGNTGKIVKNFNPLRSGDVIITLSPGWVERNGDYVTNHNSPYDCDAHVPLIWYGWSVSRAAVTRKVNMADVAATLSSLCKVRYPNACTGEPLFELFR
ncbi:MAG TPA: alkaline phosphatase family protein [Bacteroidales bacterium]|mgnify:CR=1 FL=1|nr:alkaline phosphatase family protein [Bacteroidales bacterium]HRW86099.1 alkaline phosphatase family protein [Bacteroidales bacterium]